MTLTLIRGGLDRPASPPEAAASDWSEAEYAGRIAAAVGLEQVPGWIALAEALRTRRWTFEVLDGLADDVTPLWRSDAKPALWASVWTPPGRRPVYELWLARTDDTCDTWDLATTRELLSLARRILRGDRPPEPRFRLGPWVEREAIARLQSGGCAFAAACG